MHMCLGVIPKIFKLEWNISFLKLRKIGILADIILLMLLLWIKKVSPSIHIYKILHVGIVRFYCRNEASEVMNLHINFFFKQPLQNPNGNSFSEAYSDGSRISPRGGREPSKGGGVNTQFCRILPKTAWNWKNLDAEGEGGRASLTPPLRSATGLVSLLWNELEFTMTLTNIFQRGITTNNMMQHLQSFPTIEDNMEIIFPRDVQSAQELNYAQIYYCYHLRLSYTSFANYQCFRSMRKIF